ncbi:MAG: DUF3795 domain-containing protein [Prevotella sp.]|nr:DUF3795 domain-containing protein [Prevotella sp.]
MDKITIDRRLIAACGLYCGACRKFLHGKCAECQPSEQDNPDLGNPLPSGFQRCKIRKCCVEKGFHTCAECDKDVKACKTHNNFVGKVFAILFNSDRAACIRYIRENGEQAFAEEMTRRGQQTMKRKRS